MGKLGFDIEICEAHHRGKRDAPSGTAKHLADAIAETLTRARPIFHRDGGRLPGEIGIHSVRGGGVFGEHEVRLLGDNEELAVTHRALNRAIFARGALTLSRWLLAQRAGFYTLDDVEIEALG